MVVVGGVVLGGGPESPPPPAKQKIWGSRVKTHLPPSRFGAEPKNAFTNAFDNTYDISDFRAHYASE